MQPAADLTAAPTRPAAPASSAADSLTSALEGAQLSQYEHALRELGCAEAADLVDLLEGQDLTEVNTHAPPTTKFPGLSLTDNCLCFPIGMKKIEDKSNA